MSELTKGAEIIDPLEEFLGYQLRSVSAASMAHFASAL